MESYLSVEHLGKGTFEDRKSVFHGRVLPVSTEEEALAFLELCKKEYPDAKHHVYAYILRERQTVRFSDDHEPQGTAGVPILDMMRKKGLTDVICVVTRYFGGTLLGTGGLVKAYTEAASLALADAEQIRYDIYAEVRLVFNYSDYQKADALFREYSFIEQGYDYGTSVTVLGSLARKDFESFSEKVTNATAGRVKIELISEKFDYRK